MAIKKTKEEQLVIQYLNKLGLKAYKNNRQFWDDIKRRYDKDLLKKLNDEMKTPSSSLYALKNSSLQLSLDVSKISADLYRKFFDWFALRGKAPKKILDVGCDNGIVTCFLATLYPEAEVIGIDKQPEAIDCAKELAQKCNLSNVSFLNLDIGQALTQFEKQSFDLIVSLSVFHEVFNLQTPRYWSVEELLEMDEPTLDQSTLMNLRILLQNHSESEFVTCERLPFMGAVAVWTKALTSSGFHIQWDQTQYLHFHELGEQQKMPIIVAKTQNNVELLEKVYAFESKDKVLSYFDGKIFREPEAEIVLEQVPNKELLIGSQIDFSNDSGSMRIECWKTEGNIFLYQYSNIGYRELKVFDIKNLEKAIAEFEQLNLKWAPHGTTTIYE